MNNICQKIENTILKKDSVPNDIIKFVGMSLPYNFYSICVPPFAVSFVKKQFENVRVTTVVGFPSGYHSSKVKSFEAEDLIADGADELDMVMNVGMFKAREYSYIIREINNIKKICGNRILKVIVETAFLTNEEKEIVCDIINKSDADFLKTSTGFEKKGAELTDITLFKSLLKNKKIKASGGIKESDFALDLINAGADLIGTSSGINIVEKLK